MSCIYKTELHWKTSYHHNNIWRNEEQTNHRPLICIASSIRWWAFSSDSSVLHTLFVRLHKQPSSLRQLSLSSISCIHRFVHWRFVILTWSTNDRRIICRNRYFVLIWFTLKHWHQSLSNTFWIYHFKLYINNDASSIHDAPSSYQIDLSVHSTDDTTSG